MKIWIVSDGEPLPIDDGSVRLRRMGILSNLLLRKNHKVVWFSSNFHHYTKKFRSDKFKIEKVNENQDYEIALLPTKGYKKNVSLQRYLHYKKLSNQFKKYANLMDIPDLIITTLAPLELSKEVVDFGEKNNIPVIVDIRDLWPEIYREVLPKKFEKMINVYIKYKKNELSSVLQKSTSIIGVTPLFLKYGTDLLKNGKRDYDKVFHTSYEPKNYELYENDFEKYWAKYNINKNDFIVSFIGNFGKQFEFEPIVKAMEKMKNEKIKFVLCGNGEKLEQLRSKFNDYENVIFPGWIEERQISSLLYATSIGLAPYKDSINFRNNTPNKFGEYLSAGLPILVNINGIMKDILIENNCGFKYKNGLELFDQINLLYNSQELLNEMSKNSKNVFNQRFNSEKTYNELIEFMHKLTEKAK
ncbi:glycosyltransferase family 4 protein [Exiguobacterium acetylicum]|uniref:glycosyltransferase family 4 protein n=1 Tax=Exiguobacterium acetylicum TaxID=41170 RepID=UPI0027E16F74|nr:glycosyltransferase family 4 protein [Exiguobacterium acetylicum]MDQ6467863.1 glycosyltransferase family 4 protein [Exiguobacterium acetylicum]